jgi:protoporphyrinogen oxidase
MSEIVIVGLGVSGLACALELSRAAVPFVAFERAERPGGLARTDRVGDFSFDHGPHILLGISAELESFFSSLDLRLVRCLTSSTIVVNGRRPRAIPAPFQRNLNHLPFGARAKLLPDALVRLLRPLTPPRSYADYARQRCGDGIYERFVRRYESKRLRFPLDEIAAEWATRLPPPSLASLVLPKWITGRRSGSSASEATFFYPRTGGIEALPRAMARALPADALHYGNGVRLIDLARKRLVLDHGPDRAFDQLVLSMPLPEITASLMDPPGWLAKAARDLVHTSIHVVGVGVEGELGCVGSILRFPDDCVGFYRLSVPSRYAPGSAPEGCNSIVGEFGYHPVRHPLTPAAARQQLLDGLARFGILNRGRKIVAESIHTIQYGHVIDNLQTRQSARRISSYLKEASVHTCGKYGRWQDMLMTHSISSGIEVARQLASHATRSQRSEGAVV